MKILVTGASGFVGQVLIDALKQRGIRSVGVGRHLFKSNADTIYSIPDFTAQDAWQEPLAGCDVVIHLAARVHVMDEQESDPLSEFRKVNVDATLNLAKQAAQAGVKRFVYVSSIKVNGEESAKPYCEMDAPAPQDAYGISKWEAERALHELSAITCMEIVVIRPPLVYGKGVKGNFEQMVKVLAKGIPLPFACVHNQRSLVYVENLADALILCATHPAAAGQTYLISDGKDISTTALLRQLGDALGHPARLFCCPSILLRFLGRLLGRSSQIERLLGSLQVDCSKIRCELGWAPPFSLADGLKITVLNLHKIHEK